MHLNDFNFMITILVDIAAANTNIVITIIVVGVDCARAAIAVVTCAGELKATLSFVATIFVYLIQKTLEILHFATPDAWFLVAAQKSHESVSNARIIHMCELVCWRITVQLINEFRTFSI